MFLNQHHVDIFWVFFINLRCVSIYSHIYIYIFSKLSSNFSKSSTFNYIFLKLNLLSLIGSWFYRTWGGMVKTLIISIEHGVVIFEK